MDLFFFSDVSHVTRPRGVHSALHCSICIGPRVFRPRTAGPKRQQNLCGKKTLMLSLIINHDK